MISGCAQVIQQSRQPAVSYIATPAASWLDDFLSWISPAIPTCCREFPTGEHCPPPDQPPCLTNPAACQSCQPCFAAGSGNSSHVLDHGRPSLRQVTPCSRLATESWYSLLCQKVPGDRICGSRATFRWFPDLASGILTCCRLQDCLAC